jgi:hypothetical protein
MKAASNRGPSLEKFSVNFAADGIFCGPPGGKKTEPA